MPRFLAFRNQSTTNILINSPEKPHQYSAVNQMQRTNLKHIFLIILFWARYVFPLKKSIFLLFIKINNKKINKISVIIKIINFLSEKVFVHTLSLPSLTNIERNAGFMSNLSLFETSTPEKY